MDKKSFKQMGNYLKDKRLSAKLTQVELAGKLDITPQFICNWERGACFPPSNILKKIIKMYGIEKDEFIEVLEEVQREYWDRTIFDT